MSKHPNNGPTFSKSTIKKPRPALPSPDREKAALDLKKRQAEKTRKFLKAINDGDSDLIDSIISHAKAKGLF